MDKTSILFAKFAALQKNFKDINWGPRFRVLGSHIDHLIIQYDKCRQELIETIPDLYEDLPIIKLPVAEGSNGQGDTIYTYSSVAPTIQNIDYILELRSNFRVGERKEEDERPNRIFISHGRSKEWYKVQVYLEKDLKLTTLELAQEANLGRTVLQKLNDESGRCGYAVIVMTGDDIFDDIVRARENVMHEIGYFQGKYGLQNVTLLHEEGVSIPSNIHGLVYIPFPKDTVEATFGALTRELKTIK